MYSFSNKRDRTQLAVGVSKPYTYILGEGRVQVYTVTHIYEADFGCEERADGAKAKCVVYLEDENGRQRHVEVEDEWLTANGIEEGSSWKENITDEA